MRQFTTYLQYVLELRPPINVHVSATLQKNVIPRMKARSFLQLLVKRHTGQKMKNSKQQYFNSIFSAVRSNLPP